MNQLEQAALDALDDDDDGDDGDGGEGGVDNTAAVANGPWVAGGSFTGARRVLYVR